MDYEHAGVRMNDNQLQQVPRPVRAGEEEAGRVVTQLAPCNGVLVCVGDVLIGDAVASRRLVDLHEISVLHIFERGGVEPRAARGPNLLPLSTPRCS